MKRVVLESPFSGEVARNVEYARACLRDCLRRNESPIASHLLFPQILNDCSPVERKLGIAAGLAWLAVADATVVYQDHGISAGMAQGIAAAEKAGVPVLYRFLPQAPAIAINDAEREKSA